MAEAAAARPFSARRSGVGDNGITFDRVCVDFKGRQILADVNLGVAPGEVVGFVGGSGVGKSTLLNMVAGLLKPSSGEVSIGGTSALLRARSSPPGYLFQQPTLLPWLTSLDYVALPLLVKHRPSALLNPFNQLQEDERRTALAALTRAKVEHAANLRPAEMSGGMQTRVALARTIVSQPDLLLLDEPFNSLDERLRGEIYAEVQSITAEQKATTLLVTHNVLEAVLLSDRVLLLSRPDSKSAAGVALELTIDLPRPRTLEVIQNETFLAAVARIRGALFAAQ